MKLFYGVVEDILDPRKLGRVKVRVINAHSKDKNKVPTEDLPWSLVMGSTTSPGISGLGHTSYLVQGSWVVGVFLDKEIQDFMVMGSLPTVSAEEFPLVTNGFGDPDGVFPRQNQDPDNNIRTRGGEDPDKEFNSRMGVYQPHSTYNPKYPKNHVYETEGGHLKEYDDTLGAERIREKHASGTYYEIQSNGTKVERIERDNYQLVIGDDTIEVYGSVNVVCSQNVNLSVGGNLDAYVQGEILVKGEQSANINIDKRINVEAGDEIKIHTMKHCHILAEEDINIDAGKAMKITAADDILIQSGKNIQLIGENIYINE